MKTRVIHTRFWQDTFFAEQPKYIKYIFLYLLSCSFINISGIFECADRIIIFETGCDSEELQTAKTILEKYHKAFFYQGWVMMPNVDRYNSYKNSPKNQKAYETELQLIPLIVKEHFDTVSSQPDTSIHTSMDTPINHKSEIINHKSKTINQKSEKGSEEYNAFIQGFNEIVGSSYKGTKADKEHFHARILDGYTLGSLLSATRKASQDKYLMGENDRHRRYLTPEYILRPNKLEDWLNQPESNEEERKSIFKDFIDLVNECGKKDFKGSDIAMQQLFNDLDKGFTFAQIGKVVQLAAKDNWVRSANQQRIDLYTPEYLTRQTTLERFLNSKKGGER